MLEVSCPPTNADVGANNNASTQSMDLSQELHNIGWISSSKADTSVCGGHIVVEPVNDHELRASFDPDLRTMSVFGFVVGVIKNITLVHDHLVNLKTESQPATVDESAISMELKCSESKLASAFQRFEDLHSRHLCSVDQMAVFVTTNGDIGMCYGTMNNGRPVLEASSSILKAGDNVVCVYGAGSPVLVRMSAGNFGQHCCLLLPCMIMQDCECYHGQPHTVEEFRRMRFV
jgi:hypothetical protein